MRNTLLKRALSLFVVMAMLCGSLLSAGAVGAAPKADGTVIDVTSYIAAASADGVGATTKGVIAALDHAATLGVSAQKTVSFPKGEYHFYADYAEVRELYVSNTVGTDQTYKNKHIGILVEDLENLTIDGNGSLFIYHGDVTAFASIRSKNVKFVNFAIDHASPSVVDVTVESHVDGERAVVAYVPAEYTYEIRNGNSIHWMGESGPITKQPYWQGNNKLAYTQVYDTVSGKTWRASNALFSNVKSIEEVGNHRLKFSYTTASLPPVGISYQMRNTTRTTPGTFIWESDGVTVQNVDVHFLHGFGFVGQLSKNITIDDVDFQTRPSTGRTTAGFADFLQMSSVGGKVTVKNCDFSNPHDDPINIHGTFLSVDEVSANNTVFTVRYRHNETGGFPQYYVGDEVDFSEYGSMAPVVNSKRTVTAVENFVGGDRNKIRITLDSAVPGITAGNNYVVENVTYTPEVEITNNRFIETPTRGILVTTRKPIVIEDNYFDAMGMSSIFISCDARGWYESGRTTDVTIRNNVFDRPQDHAIFVEPTGSGVRGNRVHGKMLVEDNIFNLERNVNVIEARSVADLTVQNNTFNRYNPGVALALSAGSTALNVGGTQATAVDKSGTQLSTELYNFRACDKVKLANNIYDSGLNLRANLNDGTQTADVTITGEGTVIGRDNQKPGADQVLYFSNNPSIATVDAAGVVTGVSVGTAEIFAYTVSGKRMYESNKLSFTVGASAPAVQLSGITVSSEAGTVAAGSTLQMTAAVTPAGVDAPITWSVKDAATHGDTALATINESGLLTATAAGAVEVFARTAGSAAVGSKLIAISKPAGGLNELWSIDRPSTGKNWALSEDGKLTITAQPGGDWDTGNNAHDLFLTEAPTGDFSFTVRLNNKTSGTNNWEEAGIVAFKDNNNYVAVDRKNNGSAPRLAVVTETNGRPTEHPVAGISQDYIYFKLACSGTTFTGYYSADGTNWTKIHEVTNTTLGGYKIGVIACNSGSENHNFTFQEFKINDEAVSFLSSPAHAPTATDAALSKTQSALSLAYTYAGATEKNSVLRWYAADSADGVYAPIDGAVTSTLTVTAALSEKYIKAAVLPVDKYGRAGAPVLSAALQAPALAPAEGDATLQALQLSGVTLSPAFAPATTAYTAVLPRSASKVLVSAAATQPNASITLNGKALTGSQEIAVTGDSTLTVGVTSGAATQTYTIALTHAKNSDAALSAMSLSGTGCDWSLVPGTHFYHLIAQTETDTLTLLRTPAQATTTSTVRFNHALTTDTTLTLVDGFNTFEVDTTAEDGITTEKYRVFVVKSASSDASLASIKLNDTAIAGFAPSTYEYEIPAQAGAAKITAQATHSGATIAMTVNDTPTDGNLALSEPVTAVKIVVTAADGFTKQTYLVRLLVPHADNADLLSLSVGELALSPAFAADTTTYTAKTGKASVTLSARATEAGAKLAAETDLEHVKGTGTVQGTFALQSGENVLTLSVLAPDGITTKTYTVTVSRIGDKYLSDMDWVSATTGDASKNGGLPYKDRSWEDHDMAVINADGTSATFAKGIGTHADSDIVYDLTGLGFERFKAKIGVSYTRYNNEKNESHLVFTVLGDDKQLYQSTTMYNTTAFIPIDIDITGVNKLKLRVTQTDNNYSAHGNWADAKLIPAATAPTEIYEVTVAPAEHVSVWADKKKAAVGQTVTLHVDALEAGFVVDAVTATAGGEALVVTPGENGTYTFVMPAAAVSVAVSTRAANDTVLTTQPQPQSAYIGDKATFSVAAAANNGGTLSYQWQSKRTAEAAFATISGATDARYVTPVLTAADNGMQLRCIVTNSKADAQPKTVTSAPALLTVTSRPSSSDDDDDTTTPPAQQSEVTVSAPNGAVSESQFARAVEGAKKGGDITIKAENAPQATLPLGGFQAAVKNDNDLTVALRDGGVVLSAEVMQALAKSGTGEVKVGVTRAAQDIGSVAGDPAAEQDIGSAEVPAGAPLFDISIKIGGKEQHEFDAPLTLMLTVPKLSEIKDPRVMHLLANGAKEYFVPIVKGNQLTVQNVHGLSYFAVIPASEQPQAMPFTDVQTTDWYCGAVQYAYENKLFSGTGATTFSPDVSMNRAMLWTVLARMDGQETAGGENWYSKAMLWATQNGISDGKNPNGNLTREQVAAMLHRYAQLKKQDVSVGENTNILSYEDAAQISSYAVPALQWACGAGIMNGSGDKLNPQGNATRAEVAAMLQRFLTQK